MPLSLGFMWILSILRLICMVIGPHRPVQISTFNLLFFAINFIFAAMNPLLCKPVQNGCKLAQLFFSFMLMIFTKQILTYVGNYNLALLFQP